MSALLVYDHDTSVTSGFFGCMHTKNNYQFIKTLRAAAQHASHPMLLPVIALDVWVNILRQDTFKCDNEVKDKQNETGRMERAKNDDRARFMEPEPGYEQLHSQVVQMHNRIASSLCPPPRRGPRGNPQGVLVKGIRTERSPGRLLQLFPRPCTTVTDGRPWVDSYA